MHQHTHTHTYTDKQSSVLASSSYARCESKRAGDGAIHSYTHTHQQTHASTSFVSLVRSLALSCASLCLFTTLRGVGLAEMSHCRGDSLVGCLSFGRSFVRLLRFVNLSVVWLVAASVVRVRQSVNRADVAPTVVVSICSFSQRSTQRRSATMQCLGNGTFQLL